MKKNIKRALVIVGLNVIGFGLLALPPIPPLPQSIVLSWTAHPDADGYEIRASNDVSGSYSNWPVIGFASGVSNTTYQLFATPSKMFYVILASNFWTVNTAATSLPSNITNTPNVITNGVGNVGIHH